MLNAKKNLCLNLMSFFFFATGEPWTEEEHKKFLLGLNKLGKGDWRGISRNYVVSRTPTQVASHAQKYFNRQTNALRRKRRTSLFDMVIDDVSISSWPLYCVYSWVRIVIYAAAYALVSVVCFFSQLAVPVVLACSFSAAVPLAMHEHWF